VSGLEKKTFFNPRLHVFSPQPKPRGAACFCKSFFAFYLTVIKVYLAEVHFVRLWRTSLTVRAFALTKDMQSGVRPTPFCGYWRHFPPDPPYRQPLPALRQVYNKTLAAYLFNLIVACSGFMHSQALNNLF